MESVSRGNMPAPRGSRNDNAKK
jgi:hypothetical protein